VSEGECVKLLVHDAEKPKFHYTHARSEDDVPLPRPHRGRGRRDNDDAE